MLKIFVPAYLLQSGTVWSMETESNSYKLHDDIVRITGQARKNMDFSITIFENNIW